MISLLKKIARKPFKVARKYKERKKAAAEAEKAEQQRQVIEDNTKHLTLSVSELFMQEHTLGGFNRYDMIVRLLAVESENGMNDFGWDFYRRMQTSRVGSKDLEERVDAFKKLIHSYDTNGYDAKSEIELDCNLRLIDGSHRMALALYHHIPTINVKVRPFQNECFYGIEYFKINGFSNEECRILENRYNKIMEDGINQPFICSIWHPARQHFGDITNHLALFGEIIAIKDFTLSESEYIHYTKGIYHIDDIADWKVDKKIEYMTSNKSTHYQIRMVALKISCPNFRLKEATNGTLSQRCEFIKQIIRNAYKKKIDNYFHDIILHIGDNFYQNRFLSKLMHMPPIDLTSILKGISHFDYVITKTDVPYMPSDFPSHYPMGKDIDIVCADQDMFEKVVSTIKKQLNSYSPYYDIQFVEKKDKGGECYRALIRFEQQAFLILQIDISSQVESLPISFSNELCAGKIEKNGYYIPSPSKEIIIRINEIASRPEKKHHIQYVINHIQDIDDTLCQEYLTDRHKHILNRITETIRTDSSRTVTWWVSATYTRLLELEFLLEERQIPKEEVCIVGSSILTIHDIRQNHDIDIIVSSNHRKQLGDGVHKLNDNIEIVSQDWARSIQRQCIPDDNLIHCTEYHTTHLGFKFATLDLLYQRKQWQGREKDNRDIQLIENYWKKRNSTLKNE